MRARLTQWLEDQVDAVFEQLEYAEVYFKVLGVAGLVIGNLVAVHMLVQQGALPSVVLPWWLLGNAAGAYVFVTWTRLPWLRERTVEVDPTLGLALKYGWLLIAIVAVMLAGGDGPTWVLAAPALAGAVALGVWFGAAWAPPVLVAFAAATWVLIPVGVLLAEGHLAERLWSGFEVFGGVAVPAAIVALLAHRAVPAQRPRS